MKHIFTLIFIFLTTTTFSQTNTTQLKTYDGRGYEIKYPATWEIDATGKNGPELFLFAPIVNDGDGFRANVNLQVQDFGGKPIDLAGYAKLFNDQFTRAVSDGKMLETATIKSPKGDHYKMVYTMSQGGFKLKVMAYCVIKNGKAYLLTFSASQTKYEKLKSTAEGMLNSFTFKP